MGYRTAFVGKLHYYPPTRAHALTTGFDDGLLHDGDSQSSHSDYIDWLIEQGAMPEGGNFRVCKADRPNPYTAAIADEHHETTWAGEQTRGFIRELAGREQPFFLFCSHWKPHSPFEVPEPWASMYNDAEIKLPRRVTREYYDTLPRALKTFSLRINGDHGNICETNDDIIKWKYRAYYGAISQIDREVGRTLDLLDELGIADNTIVVFCSDHGDVMYEHGMIDKNTFFDSAIHVPFMIRYPSVVTPGIYDQLAESTDVMSTLLELCGGEVPWIDQGNNLCALITPSGGEYREREYVFAENIIPEVITGPERDFYFYKNEGVKGIRHPDAKMVRSKQWKYNYYVGEEELYDLENDPEEMTNLAGAPGCAAIKQTMKNALLDWVITADETSQIAPRWSVVKDGRDEWVDWVDNN